MAILQLQLMLCWFPNLRFSSVRNFFFFTCLKFVNFHKLSIWGRRLYIFV